MVLTTTLNMKAFKLQVEDTVSITNSRFGFSSKQFEVAEWVMNTEQVGIDIILKETAS